MLVVPDTHNSISTLREITGFLTTKSSLDAALLQGRQAVQNDLERLTRRTFTNKSQRTQAIVQIDNDKV